MSSKHALSDIATTWQRIRAILDADSRVSGQLSGFINLIVPKGLIGSTLVLEVPDELAREMIEHRARLPLLNALSDVQSDTDDHSITSFAVVVNNDLQPSPPEPPKAASPQPHSDPKHPLDATQSTTPVLPVAKSRLNPKYTFDNFVIGSSNRFAHAAAFAVAEAPAKAYNPLFIYGESGLGKTHLLHAIGHYALNLFPGIRVRYVSSEEFTNDFINSIQRNEASDFQSRYRDIDILLIDDIQFLQGKDSTQEAFFHTFNNLHDHNKQVVITSDLPPKQLTGFQERMTSRFEWGLTTDVQAPDLETRIAILRRKAQSERITIPDDILEFVASKVSSNIRELEGTLLRVTAYSSIEQQPITLQLVQSALKDIVTLDENNVIDPESIISQTADYFQLTPDDIVGPSRSQQIAQARQIAMYVCRELTTLSLPKIGQVFGNRDHTTVMYANNKISKLMKERRQLYTQVTEIMTEIKQAHK